MNKLRKQQLLDKLINDFQPQTTLAHSSCEILAGILEQLEVLKPGSIDHQRLVQQSLQLGDALQASRPARTPASVEDLTPEKVVERCAEIKATNYSAWEVLHQRDPEMVEKKASEATAVMMRQVGKPLPDWYR